MWVHPRARSAGELKNSGESRTCFDLCQKIYRGRVATRRVSRNRQISWHADCHEPRRGMDGDPNRSAIDANGPWATGIALVRSSHRRAGSIAFGESPRLEPRHAIAAFSSARARATRLSKTTKKYRGTRSFCISRVWIIQQLLPIALLYTVIGIPVARASDYFTRLDLRTIPEKCTKMLLPRDDKITLTLRLVRFVSCLKVVRN